MNVPLNGAPVLDIGVGLGVLIAGIGIFVAMLALAKMLRRVNTTLDEVDRQLEGMGKPLSETLSHVGGIADTADRTLVRLGRAVGSLENVTESLSQTAQLAKDAISPAIVNFGATLTGVSAGVRRLLTGRK